MTAKESIEETRKRDPKRGPKRPAIEIEDHTDAETQAEIAEAVALLHWVQAQRAAGNLPN